MRYSILILPIVALVGCSAPQAPSPPTATTIPGLNIPDTIDFGVVRVGMSKDTNVLFKNTGSDTIQILSQRLSDTNFKLSNTSQTQLSIAPGSSQVVRIQFSPRDASSAFGNDTIRTENKTSIIMLRGNAIPFVSSSDLSIPDTIDFGAVKAGATSDTAVVFQNTGADTLKITSQRFSDSSFRLSKASQSQLNIAPGASQMVSIRFLARDTVSVLGYDTIRMASTTKILELKGKGIPFSSLFLFPPSTIYVQLSGLIGQDTDGTTHPFTFSFSANLNTSGSLDSSLAFDGATEQTTYDPNDPMRILDEKASATNVELRIDPPQLSIDSLTASYSFQDQPWGQGTNFSDYGLNLHGLILQRDSNKYSAEIKGSSLSGVVERAYFETYGYTLASEYILSYLTSIVGYQDSAKLTVSIQ